MDDEPRARIDEVTRLLRLAGDGDGRAVDDLLPLLYDELRRLAGSFLGQERPDHTLQATALVHEAYVKLVGQDSIGFGDRAQFFRAAATAMRRILVDHARTKKRAKRGGGALRTSLDDVVEQCEAHSGDMIELDDALGELAEKDPEKARLVELRFFAGLPLGEAAEMLGLPLRTAERHWAMARAFLKSRLADTPEAE